MKTTCVALALLAATVSALPNANAPAAMSKRGSQGSAGPMGGSGYDAPVKGGNFKDECLQAHNDARKAYGAPPLRWNDKLARSAQGWSNNIGRNMEHSQAKGYGENLAYNSNGSPRNMILSQWFDECPQYTGGFSHGAGHYSQCVWKGTTDIGCGMNKNNMLVCQYYPAGNMGGGYDKNVPRGRCVKAANLKPGSGGGSPAPAGPSYGGGDESPAPTGPSYGGGDESPTPAGPSYGGDDSDEEPTGGNPGYGNGGQSPDNGGRPHGGRPHGGRPHGGRPQRPAPQAADEDCDENDQSPTGGNGGRPHGGNGGRPHGGNGGRPQGGYESGPSRHGSKGGKGDRPSYGSKAGNGDEDCDES